MRTWHIPQPAAHHAQPRVIRENLAYPPARPPTMRSRVSAKKVEDQKVAGPAIVGERGAEKSRDTARWPGSVPVSEVNVLTGNDEEHLHAN